MKILSNVEEVKMLVYDFMPEMTYLYKYYADINNYIKKISENAVVLVDDPLLNNGMIIFYANDFDSYIAYISIIIVKDDYKNNGVGKRLIICASRIAKENGMKTIALRVRKTNTNAIGFYRHLGFELDSKDSDQDTFMLTMSILHD